MKTDINNYEEIMFRLVEDDFDESTRAELLREIESDSLFKFEWESWQKTKFFDPLENYAVESNELTEKIILIAEPKPAGQKRFFYYWAAAASILSLIASLFLMTTDFNSKPKQIVVKVSKPQTPVINVIEPVQNKTVTIAVVTRKQAQNQRNENKSIQAVVDFNTILPTENTLTEIPKVVDSIPIKTNELAKVPEKKPRYAITIESSPLIDNNLISSDLAQNRKVKVSKLFTNTKLFLQRKANGEPEKIVLIGDENNYICINLNYSER